MKGGATVNLDHSKKERLRKRVLGGRNSEKKGKR